MKRVLIGSVVLLATASAGSAVAADLALLPAPVFSWSGWYLGGTVGGAWGTFDPTTSTVFNPTTGYFPNNAVVGAVNAAGIQSIKASAVTAGLEWGYNWQMGNVVLGYESDIESIRLSGGAMTGPIVYPGIPLAAFTIASATSANWLSTTRARLGWANGNWLFYGTGGLAVTNLNAQFSFADNPFGSVESGIFTNTRLNYGWTVGGGVEVGLWDRWSVKAEYLYVNFPTTSITSTNLLAFGGIPVPGQVFTHSADLKANIARVGLNYRF